MRKLIRVPNNLFQPKNVDGKLGKVYIYALDATTIGITPEYSHDWASPSLYVKTWKTQREGSNWRIILPTRVRKFYLLGEAGTKLVTSINDGRILITVTRR